MQQVAAGYILYGSSVMFVYTTVNGVNGFTLDPAIGSFLLSNPTMKIPESNAEYSVNEGNLAAFDSTIQKYLMTLKSGETPYRLRYIGSFVADIHRILTRGGIFLYPHDTKNPAGKLRLMHEVNPISMLVYHAGGMAISTKLNQITNEPINLLTVSAQDIHERTPVIMGSKHEVEKFIGLAQNKEYEKN
jgi:fructose-1,6-bisphosphatase I